MQNEGASLLPNDYDFIIEQPSDQQDTSFLIAPKLNHPKVWYI